MPTIDATCLHAFEGAIKGLRRDCVEIFLAAVRSQPMKVMFEAGLAERIGLDRFWANIDQALTAVGLLPARALLSINAQQLVTPKSHSVGRINPSPPCALVDNYQLLITCPPKLHA